MTRKQIDMCVSVGIYELLLSSSLVTSPNSTWIACKEILLDRSTTFNSRLGRKRKPHL